MTTPWIKTENIFSNPEGSFTHFPSQYSTMLWKVTIILTSVPTIRFTCSWTSRKWNQIMCICLSPALFFSLESMRFIRVGDARTVRSLPLPRSSPPYECHGVCVHPSVNGHTDCFQFGVIKNKVTRIFLCLFLMAEALTAVGHTSGTRRGRQSVLADTAELPKGMCQFTLLARWGEF